MLFNLFFILAITLTNACQLECPLNWEPVCGTDGKTYGNLCQLQSLSCQNGQQVSVASKGECQQKQQQQDNNVEAFLHEMTFLKRELVELKSQVNRKDVELTELRDKVGIMESKLDDHDNDLQESVGSNPYGGATYVRWGRTECPGDSELVYKGYAGGTYIDHRGGGSNYLCLPENPNWNTYNDVSDGTTRGRIYGAEYETSGDSFPFSEANLPSGEHLNEKNAPCAVCYNPLRTSVLMVPAKDTCHSGWTREYYGYLVGGAYSWDKFEYVCMDNAPEILPDGSSNQDGAGFFNAESICDLLPCPPYVNFRELTCVVCTH